MSTVVPIARERSNEVKNSHHMELEGLKRGLSFLEQKGCAIKEVITDRHVSVKKYMREEHKDKKHYFDVGHVTKGVGKKLEAAAKKSGCAAIRPWIKSTTNHMYWVAASCKDDPDMKVDKWLSVTNHVANKHEGHSAKFKQCEHAPLTEERLWLKEGSKPYKAFMEVVSSGYLVRDLPNPVSVYETYALEVFHSVVNHFAPKNTHYFYAAMMAR
ncbi:LOW QUALITY PROTEIN: uncharacterized protein LOC124269188 [Haliotis rubra]|uniref:LOW QUALITY PROTEIN: uncharacterized protein LOC124269188 n=1 Tax=Haliotis rubra TaxID=36100 RepID=UPI001EE54BBA|nr:LOW QUALITY PROTEIN: uncharacterized protein LOC124269188 [Haliotis rubra]